MTCRREDLRVRDNIILSCFALPNCLASLIFSVLYGVQGFFSLSILRCPAGKWLDRLNQGSNSN